jgi:nickel/cobalt exporter
VLGLMTLYASQRVSLERILPALSLASGLLVASIGVWLLWQRLRGPGDHHHHEAPSGGGLVHRHGLFGAPHHHSVEETPGKGSLLSLGVSGGLVPCPEALVVLMLSVSLGRVALGLALLASFTLGLAAVLMAIGCTMVLAGPAMKKLSGGAGWIRALPVASAAVVTLLGVVMIVEAVRGS